MNITDNFLQSFVLGTMRFDFKGNWKNPSTRGRIEKITLSSGFLTVSILNQEKKIEMAMTFCDLVGSPLDRKLIFESPYSDGFLLIKRPSARFLENHLSLNNIN
jgi:hypothetical protein